MGQEESRGEEKGFGYPAFELLDRPTGDFPISFVFVAMGEQAPVHERVVLWRVDQFLRRARADFGSWPQDVEFTALATVAAMVDLAG